MWRPRAGYAEPVHRRSRLTKRSRTSVWGLGAGEARLGGSRRSPRFAVERVRVRTSNPFQGSASECGAGTAGVRLALGVQDDELAFLIGERPMLDSPWHDYEL